jgi:hypothetical protein
MMIYGSFALMVWHWLPVVILAWVWGGLFAVNMVFKETSMSRYPEWGRLQAKIVVAAAADLIGTRNGICLLRAKRRRSITSWQREEDGLFGTK